MDGFARILLHMYAGNSDPRFPAVLFYVHVSAFRKGVGELCDLISLREVGIEIIFPCPGAFGVHRAVGGNSHLNRVCYHRFVQNRENAGHPQAYGTGIAVRFLAEPGRTSAEYFRFGKKLGVYLEPYNRFIFHYKLGLLVSVFEFFSYAEAI